MTNSRLIAWKTILFVPANKPKYLDSAIKHKPDAVQLDLEDSVITEQKADARQGIEPACEELNSHDIPVVIRINNDPEYAELDLAVAVNKYVSAITIPKLESLSQVQQLDQKITTLETSKGMLTGSIKILGLIETLTGLRNQDSWRNAPRRLHGLALGSEDLCKQIQCAPTQENLLEPCRQVLYAAREAGLSAWGMPISIGEFNNTSELETAMQQAKTMGMDGVWCIHPDQVKIAARVFKTTENELAAAHEIIKAFEQAKEDGDGAVNVNGAMVDLPVYERAKALVEQNK